MSRKAALIGFLLMQVIAVALWVSAIQPYLGEAPVTGQQIWSGRGFSNLSTNFRSGSQVVLAAPFQASGALMWATLLMVSASSATDPLPRTTSTCRSAVTPSATRLIFTARMPWLLASSAESTESTLSWLCGAKTVAIAPRQPVP